MNIYIACRFHEYYIVFHPSTILVSFVLKNDITIQESYQITNSKGLDLCPSLQ